MAIIPGTHGLKEAVGEYDFAVDGGAISTIVLRSPGNTSTGNDIPNGSVIVDGYIEVDTPFTSGGAATVAVNSQGAGDLLAAALVSGAPWSTTGRKDIVPNSSAATSIKTTAARNIAITIAVAALTAGKGRVVVFYR